MRRGFRILDQIQGVEYGALRPRHHAVLGPDDQGMLTQSQHGLHCQLRRTDEDKWQHTHPIWKIEDCFRLPAQDVTIQILLILIFGEMAEVG